MTRCTDIGPIWQKLVDQMEASLTLDERIRYQRLRANGWPIVEAIEKAKAEKGARP